MTTSPASLDSLAARFVSTLAETLSGGAAERPELADFAAGLRGIDCGAARAQPAVRPALSALSHLGPALDAATGPMREIAREAVQQTTWYQLYEGAGVDPALARGMLAAQVAGPAGLVESQPVRTGFFLLAPGVHYPLHTHEAAEVYYCISGTLGLMHGIRRAPFQLHPGEASVTRPHLIHSLTTGSEPVLLAYVWTGAVDAPNWWWACQPDGSWQRTRWQRQPDGRWCARGMEPVSPEVLRAAEGA